MIRQNKQQGFHCHRNGAVPILSLSTLHFQFYHIQLGPSHNQCSNAKGQPSTYHMSLMLYRHPASQGQWRQECSSTKGRWRSQRSATQKGFFSGHETVHGGNHIQKDSLANHFRWELLHGLRSLETSNWSSGSSAGISRCSCRCTICVSIAWWSISSNKTANLRRCKCMYHFLYLD